MGTVLAGSAAGFRNNWHRAVASCVSTVYNKVGCFSGRDAAAQVGLMLRSAAAIRTDTCHGLYPLSCLQTWSVSAVEFKCHFTRWQ